MNVLAVVILLMLALGSNCFTATTNNIIGQRRPTRTLLAHTNKISASKMDELQMLTGIRDVVDRYDTFLLDMWYVRVFFLLNGRWYRLSVMILT